MNTPRSSIHNIIPGSFSLNYELICEYFINNSEWRLEINKSSNDLNFISVTLLLLNSQQCTASPTISQTNIPTTSGSSSRSESNPEKFIQYLEKSNSKLIQNLNLKLKLYLFNSELTEIFERNSIECQIDLKKIISSSQIIKTLNRSQRSILIDRFRIDKFCKIKDLLRWLNKRKSDDFCLISEFKFYSEREQLEGNVNLEKVHIWILKIGLNTNYAILIAVSARRHHF